MNAPWKAVSNASIGVALAVVLTLVPPTLVEAGGRGARTGSKDSKGWTDSFRVESCKWESTGKNDYFVLEPGWVEILEQKNGKGRLVITVLAETKTIDNVVTRVVEERETNGGEVEEVSRNYFAVCQPSGDIFYFGEDSSTYKDGEESNQEGSWLAGVNGAKAGLFMPARPLLGSRFYQEHAEGTAMDRVEIVSDTASLDTPAGQFTGCLKTEETTPMEPGVREYKIYARGIGVIQDEDLLLVKSGFLTPAGK